MFSLTANGSPVLPADVDDSPMVVLENDEDAPQWRCTACGDYLTEMSDGWADESGDRVCCAYDPADPMETESVEGPHSPERVALSWANNAGVRADTEEDSFTVTISVGDPRGAFAFTVRRIPDGDHEHAGCLVLHSPHPEESAPHARLTELHPGTFLIG